MFLYVLRATFILISGFFTLSSSAESKCSVLSALLRDTSKKSSKQLLQNEVETRIKDFGTRINSNKDHMWGVFQDVDFSPPRIPVYVENLRKEKAFSNFESLKAALRTINPKVADLTDQFVKHENLRIFMFRHESPAELKKKPNNQILNAFEDTKNEESILRPEIPVFSESVLGVSGETLLEQPRLLPKHAFLWFEKVPPGFKLELIYRKMWRHFGIDDASRITNYFGDNLYQVEIDAVKSRTTYTLGDIVFSLRKNRYQVMKSLMPNRGSADFQLEQINGFKRIVEPHHHSKIEAPNVQVRGTFPLSDLRGLYLYMFEAIDSAIKYPINGKRVIAMPADEAVEVAIFGDLESLHLKPVGANRLTSVQPKPRL